MIQKKKDNLINGEKSKSTFKMYFVHPGNSIRILENGIAKKRWISPLLGTNVFYVAYS